MKELFPYFKILKPVKLQFALAIFCAVVYGLSSGFGLPYITREVFPLIFNSESQSVNLYTKLDSGKFFAVEGKSEAHSKSFYSKRQNEFIPFNQTVQLTPKGMFIEQKDGSSIVLSEPLYIETDSKFIKVEGGLYQLDGTTNTYVSLSQEQKQSSQWVLILAVLMLPLVFAIRGLSSFFNIYLNNYCGLHVLEVIRLQVFKKLQDLPISFFHKHKSGDLLNRLLGDTTALQNAISAVSNDIVKQPITLIGGVGYLIYQSIQQQESAFILLCFAIIAVCVFPIRFVGKQLLKRVYQLQEQLGSISAIASENISAYREVKAFNLQERESSRFEKAAQLYFKLQLKVVKYNAGLNPMIEIITAFGIAMAIYYASQKGITLNDIIPLMMALYMSYDPIKKMGSINNSIKSGLAAIKRLNFIIHQVDETPEPTQPQMFPDSIDSICFKQLNFAYGHEWVLKDINLEIKDKEVIAMVGPSGAGKSTFGSLLPRFYDPKEGEITINGMDLRALRKKQLRDHISIVSQDTVLFDETVAENIRIGKPHASDEEVENAAKQAQAHDFISTMQEGYRTRIGERGTRLSGGQKQRIAIARAFLKNAPILILDEATSALDSESEAKIQTALEKLIVGKTVFIIAHRFSTIKLANRILVFDKGHIVGDGTHEELIESCELYKDLHKRQELE